MKARTFFRSVISIVTCLVFASKTKEVSEKFIEKFKDCSWSLRLLFFVYSVAFSHVGWAENQSQIDDALYSMTNRITNMWQRPPLYQEGWEVYLKMALSPSGILEDVRVVQTSGNDDFDQSGLAAIRDAAPFFEVATFDEQTFEQKFKILTVKFRPEGNPSSNIKIDLGLGFTFLESECRGDAMPYEEAICGSIEAPNDFVFKLQGFDHIHFLKDVDQISGEVQDICGSDIPHLWHTSLSMRDGWQMERQPFSSNPIKRCYKVFDYYLTVGLHWSIRAKYEDEWISILSMTPTAIEIQGFEKVNPQSQKEVNPDQNQLLELYERFVLALTDKYGEPIADPLEDVRDKATLYFADCGIAVHQKQFRYASSRQISGGFGNLPFITYQHPVIANRKCRDIRSYQKRDKDVSL